MWIYMPDAFLSIVAKRGDKSKFLVQARLLSRFLLGELPSYPHYLPR